MLRRRKKGHRPWRRLCLLADSIAPFLLIALTACDPGVPSGRGARPQPEAVSLVGRFATQIINIEIADDPAEQTRGLMDRTVLSSDHGMLFVYDDDAERPFWMHHTHVSLDMIFLDADRRIVGIIRRAKPNSDEILTIGKPCRSVLEVEGGLSDRIGIREGDTVEFR